MVHQLDLSVISLQLPQRGPTVLHKAFSFSTARVLAESILQWIREISEKYFSQPAAPFQPFEAGLTPVVYHVTHSLLKRRQ